MPIYVYQVINNDGSEGDIFEIEQQMADPHLKKHPVTGEPVRRVFQPPNIGIKYTPGQTAKRLESKNIERAGFTKYERDKLTGAYHRVAGKEGPSQLNPN